MNEFYPYITHFFLALVIGMIVCIGVWLSSRGETEIDPQGRKRDVFKMILYPLYKAISGERLITVKYREQELKQLVLDLHLKFPENKVNYDTKLSMGGNIVLMDGHKGNWLSIANELESKYSIKIFISDSGYLSVWKEYYEFNWWAKPIIACYKCYASFWGSIVFWAQSALAIHTGYLPSNYWVLIVMWLIFVPSLVPLNQLLYKLTKD